MPLYLGALSDEFLVEGRHSVRNRHTRWLRL
jgi:hypothetical protein